MFKEQLKNEIDKITPPAELLDRVSLMMSEQAEKPRRSPYAMAARYAGAAAAVFLIAFGAVKLGNIGGDDVKVQSRTEAAAEAAETGKTAETSGAEASPETEENVSDEEYPADEPALFSMTPPDDAENETPEIMPRGESSPAYGGDGIESDYWFPINIQLSIIDGDFVDLIGAELFDSWQSENRFSPEYNDYTDIDRFFNLYSYIRFAGLDAQTAEKTMRGINERFIRYGMEPMYSEEDIYILTHGTEDEIAEHFANSRTVCHNGKLYTIEWFDTHTVEDYRAEGIPPEKIKEKLADMLYLCGFYDLNGFAEKIGAYIGETVELPAVEDVPHPRKRASDDPDEWLLIDNSRHIELPLDRFTGTAANDPPENATEE